MASDVVRLDSLDTPVEDSKRPTDANSNDVQNSAQDSVESGFQEDDASSRGAASLGGSLSSLSETATEATPTEEERQAWLDEVAKIDEEAATLRLVLQVAVWGVR